MIYQRNNIAIDLCLISYKLMLKKKEMNKTTLDSADFLFKKKISCPKFSGTGGIKGLLWVEESFQNIFKQFKWDTDGDKLSNNFNLVVEEGAANHWETIIDGKALTVRKFDACMDQFRIIYSLSDVRDIMYQYLSSSKCNHPKEVEVINHKC